MAWKRSSVRSRLAPPIPRRGTSQEIPLPPPNGGHFASITEPAKIGALLRSMEGYEGTHVASLGSA
jgi:hypothetical protein